MVVALLALVPGWASAATLTRVDQILHLSAQALRQHPAVRVRGVVTYYRPEGVGDLVIQDDSGGIFVNRATADVARTLRPGAVVELEGVAVEGNFSPRINATVYTLLGTNALPEPIRASFDDVRSGRFDCRYIEAAGIVRSAAVDDTLTPPRLIVRVATPVGLFDAWVLRFGSENGASLVDAAVRVRGVCIAWDNPRRQLTNVRLLVNNLDAISVLRAAAPDPFAAPLVAPHELLRYRPEGMDAHRTRLRGVVTWHQPGENLVLQNGSIGVRVNSAGREPLRLGDEVEAAGFPGLTGNSAGLFDAVYRVMGHTNEPAPQGFTARQLLDGPGVADADQRLVRMSGTLRAVQRDGRNINFYLENDGVSFIAALARDEKLAWPGQIEPGSVLELTGVCDGRASERAWRSSDVPNGFALLLRDRRDVVVLRAGPWLNQRRLLIILSVGLGALGLAMLWAFTLRRRVEKRTAQLAREIRSRHDAAAEFEVVQSERDRLAAELHDTVQQTLTGAALQLRAAELALTHAPDEVRPHVDHARQMLEHSRDELRDAVWDLRADTAAAENDLAAALREATASAQTGSGRPVTFSIEGEPRPIPPTLAHHAARIAQEALTNALRHSGARAVAVTLAFAPQKLRLVIRDDGHGFAPARADGPASGHFGLDGMKRRAARVGATLTIESNATGTTITLQAPLP